MTPQTRNSQMEDALDNGEVSKEQVLNHYIEVTKHKWEVFKQLGKVCWRLIQRGIVHDLSKYSDDEAIGFAKYTDILEDTTYGSDEYKEVMEKFEDIINLHYSRNPHHPEYYDGTLDKMGLLDTIEMVCDWKAATKRHADGSLIDSIYKNQERFDYSNATAAKILLLATHTGLIGLRDINQSDLIEGEGTAGVEEFKREFYYPSRGWQDTPEGEEYLHADALQHG